MSKIDWRKASLSAKRSTSIRDEDELRDRDAASRWLKRKAKAPNRRQNSRNGVRT